MARDPKPPRSARRPRRVGLIGGIGPEATVVYYRLVIEAYRRRRPDGSAPPLLINSIDVTRLLRFVEADDLGGLTDYLVDEVNHVAAAGAEIAAIGANTPHLVFDAVQARVPIPLISIVDATAKAAVRSGYRRIGLLGTAFTMQAPFYPEVLGRAGVEVVPPNLADQVRVDAIYRTELLAGVVRDVSRARLLEVIERLRVESGIEAVILGGTELSIILDAASGAVIPFLDTTRIHAEAIVERMLH